MTIEASLTDSIYRRASQILFVVALLCVALFFRDHGVSWDEKFQMDWGEEKFAFYAGLLTGEHGLEAAAEMKGSALHGGFFDLIAASARRVLPFRPIDTNHLLSALFGVATAAAAWAIGRLLGGERMAFFAALFVLCMPRVFGHMWFNPKDTPNAACFIWALYFVLRLLQNLPRIRWTDTIGVGVATAFTVGVRPLVGLMIPCFLAAAWSLFVLGRVLEQRTFTVEIKASLIRMATRGVAAAAIAIVLALPFVPSLWLDTGERAGGSLGETVERAQSFDWVAPVLHGGDYIMSNELPTTYLPHWMLVTTPEFILVLLAAGLAFGVLALRALPGWSARLQGRSLQVLTLAMAVVLPLAYVMLTRPTLYDGLRHFLFLLPPLAVLAAVALEATGAWLKQRYPDMDTRRWLNAGVGVMCAVVVFHYIRAHPYQYVYFNSIAGGTTGAYGNYETDYWGLSYRESVERLDASLGQVYGETGQPPIKVSLGENSAWWLAKPFFPEHWTYVREQAEANFVLSYTRLQEDLRFRKQFPKARIIGVVESKGVPLNFVFLQKPPPGFMEKLGQAAAQPIQTD